MVRSGVSLGAFRALISISRSLVQNKNMDAVEVVGHLDSRCQGSRSFFSAACNLGNDSRSIGRQPITPAKVAER